MLASFLLTATVEAGARRVKEAWSVIGVNARFADQELERLAKPSKRSGYGVVAGVRMAPGLPDVVSCNRNADDA